jgi:polyisoprenoid-binding protein YceI
MSHQQVAWLLAVVWLLVAAAANRLQAQTEITISFVIVNAGVDVFGTIGVSDRDIQLDPRNPEAGMVRITAKPSTLHTGIALRDKHLQQADYFDVERYPVIVMRSRSFRKAGRNRFSGEFDLTIKGITRQVAIQFSGKAEGNAMRYNGQFEIDRLDFKLGDRSLVLDEVVKIYISVMM